MDYQIIISIVTAFIAISGQLYGYHRSQRNYIKEVKADLLLLRTNDLYHINEQMGIMTDHIFRLSVGEKKNNA